VVVLVFLMDVQVNFLVHIHGVKDMVVLHNDQIALTYQLFFNEVVFGDLIGLRMLIIHKCVLKKFHVQLNLQRIQTVFENKTLKCDGT
jgi:hypothetical protein